MISTFCKNCGLLIEVNFCSNCGQKTNTKRLDWNYIFDEAKYTFLHLNNGLLYTCKQLLIRPGDMVREFIEGKRVKHYKPLLLVFVLAGISTFLAYFNGDLTVLSKLNNENANVIFDATQYTNMLTKYYTLVQIISVPLIAFCTWLAFRKWGYNYIENIIINCFATAQLLIIGIITTPIKMIFVNSSLLILVTTILSLIAYCFNIWLFLNLYRGKDLGLIILRLLLVLFYFGVIFLMAIIFTFIYLLSQGHFNNFKPV